MEFLVFKFLTKSQFSTQWTNFLSPCANIQDAAYKLILLLLTKTGRWFAKSKLPNKSLEILIIRWKINRNCHLPASMITSLFPKLDIIWYICPPIQHLQSARFTAKSWCLLTQIPTSKRVTCLLTATTVTERCGNIPAENMVQTPYDFKTSFQGWTSYATTSLQMPRRNTGTSFACATSGGRILEASNREGDLTATSGGVSSSSGSPSNPSLRNLEGSWNKSCQRASTKCRSSFSAAKSSGFNLLIWSIRSLRTVLSTLVSSGVVNSSPSPQFRATSRRPWRAACRTSALGLLERLISECINPNSEAALASFALSCIRYWSNCNAFLYWNQVHMPWVTKCGW